MLRRGSMVLLLAACLPGCGWLGDDESNQSADDLPEIRMAEAIPREPAKIEMPKEKLTLNLNVGDRFPLMKTVEQTLTQATAQGDSTSRSKLELLLAITVEELREGSKRLGVRYHRVRYSHDIAGEKVVFDSQTSPGPAPWEVRGYHGLINNSFSFWIGPDNKISELVGFNAFLERCMTDVPEEHRKAVMAQLIETSGEEGIANFVDDSIGLLPYDTNEAGDGSSVGVGDSWVRERRFTRPVPIYLNSKCTLRSLSDQIAEVELVGTIAANTPYLNQVSHQNEPINITVRGGNSFGNCTIDRQTGLPIQSRIEHHFDMIVKDAAGKEFGQSKRLITTIQAFPQQQDAQATPATEPDATSTTLAAPTANSPVETQVPVPQ